jgi:hypothetical protein
MYMPNMFVNKHACERGKIHVDEIISEKQKPMNAMKQQN